MDRTDNETDVDMDEGKNELKKNRPNLHGNEGTKAAKEAGEDKKHLKVSKRPRLEVDVKSKRFKKETVFCYGDVKLTVTDEYVQEPICWVSIISYCKKLIKVVPNEK